MNRYASETTVSVEKSRAEIESTLVRYKATGFAYGWQGDIAIIGFTFADRQIRFELMLPNKDDKEFALTPSRRNLRSQEDRLKAWEQACRQAWRALLLVIKAKLEAVSAGITTFEEEFMAHIVMPDGKTFGRWALPQIEQSYKTHAMPPLLGVGNSHE